MKWRMSEVEAENLETLAGKFFFVSISLCGVATHWIAVSLHGERQIPAGHRRCKVPMAAGPPLCADRGLG